MKSILLSILCATSLAVPKTEDFRKVCNAHTKHITTSDNLYQVVALPGTSFPFSNATKIAACKELTKGKVFAGVKAELTSMFKREGKNYTIAGTVAIDLLKKYVPKYDGINFDVSQLLGSENLMALLQGWNEEKKLSLTMSGEQWPLFKDVINSRKGIFDSLYFKFKNMETLLAVNTAGKLHPKSKVPTYFALDDHPGGHLDYGIGSFFDWIQRALPWVKGSVRRQKYYGDTLLLATDFTKQ